MTSFLYKLNDVLNNVLLFVANQATNIPRSIIDIISRYFPNALKTILDLAITLLYVTVKLIGNSQPVALNLLLAAFLWLGDLHGTDRKLAWI